MKIARIIYEGRESYAKIEGSSLVLLKGRPGEAFRPAGGTIELSQARLLAPCKPSKALCIGLNYRDHAQEFGLAIPTSPVVFIKPATALLDPFGSIVWPELSKRVEYEAELVVVIGRKAKNLKVLEALDYVLGYTCGNDVTARDLQPKEGQWTVAKSFDSFMPLGPWIETELDPADLDGIISMHLIESDPALSRPLTDVPGVADPGAGDWFVLIDATDVNAIIYFNF